MIFESQASVFSKGDTQLSELGGNLRPEADPQNKFLNFYFRHQAVIEPSKVATSYRHAWALKFDWIDWRGATILRVPAEFS
jgi:hypothetical protein